MRAALGFDQLGSHAQWMCVVHVLAVAEKKKRKKKGPGRPGVVPGVCPTPETQTRHPSADKFELFLTSSPFCSSGLFLPVVSEGSVCEIRRAWAQVRPRPVVSLVPVVGLLQNLRGRRHVQGAILHQPQVRTVPFAYEAVNLIHFHCSEAD